MYIPMFCEIVAPLYIAHHAYSNGFPSRRDSRKNLMVPYMISIKKKVQPGSFRLNFRQKKNSTAQMAKASMLEYS